MAVSMTQKLNWSFSAPLGPLNYSSSNGAPVPTMQRWGSQHCKHAAGGACTLYRRSSKLISSSRTGLGREIYPIFPPGFLSETIKSPLFQTDGKQFVPTKKKKVQDVSSSSRFLEYTLLISVFVIFVLHISFPPAISTFWDSESSAPEEKDAESRRLIHRCSEQAEEEERKTIREGERGGGGGADLERGE